VVDIIPDKEIILIKGSIPGCKNSLVFVERWCCYDNSRIWLKR
jgi:ribosomal protein L3